MVLEAWEKAEKIWYQYIGQEVKEPSNVIDYNINKEITKDASNVINANNDTTTWMATLIYWVNAPKLLEKTSVYRNEVSLQWQSTLAFTQTLVRPDDYYWSIRTATITKNYGNITFENVSIEAYYNNWVQTSRYNWVEVPVSWWYQLDITWARWAWSSWLTSTWIKIANWISGGVTVKEHLNQNAWTVTESMKYYFNAWDKIYVYNEFTSTLSTSTHNMTTTIVITLL